MDLGLAGRCALVTGGSMGIGKAAALALAAEGCRVAIAARGAPALTEAAAEIGHETLAVQADCTRPEDIRRMVEETLARMGRIDILVNSIGAAKSGDFLDLSDDDWRESLELKLYGIVRSCREVVPHMRRCRWGRIVNVIGHRGRQPDTQAMPAGVANAGLINFTKALADDVVRYGILVNGVSPCPMETRRLDYMVRAKAQMTGVSESEARDEFLRDIPIGRFALPEEIAPLIAFLASERNSYVTGVTIAIDGGATRAT
ncbi:MAG TPA: SDR family oxidoreductase [Burkholderiales bacterium]|nr:SDR family oxidoreductase [Burkholderiales bacterium]